MHTCECGRVCACAWYAAMHSRAPVSVAGSRFGGGAGGARESRTSARAALPARVVWGAYALTLRTSQAPWIFFSLQLTRSCST